MNVAVISHFFPPEPCAAANRAEALVRALLRAGHSVTVVTNFPSFPEGRLQQGDRYCFIRRERSGGARVVRLLTLRFGNSPLGRVAHWVASAFSFTAFLMGTVGRFNAIVVTMPPITLALPAVAVSLHRRCRLVVDVRDVYPDVAIAMGAWREGGLFARASGFVTRLAYRRAALISTVTRSGLRQIEARGVGAERLVLAPNGADTLPDAAETKLARTPFTAVFAGNLGVATDVDVLVDAAALLACERSIAIAVIGDGARAQHMRERIARERVDNIRMLGALPRAQTTCEIAAAGVALVPLRKGIVDSIPTKIFDAFAVRCPVVVCADGEAGEAVLQSGGGMCVPAGDAHALADAIRRFSTLDERARREIGERGRSFVQRFYLRDVIMDRLCVRIAEV